MLNKMSITWNCKQVANMVKKGKCSFDNIVQRSYVWEPQRMSDLIHSIVENFPVPPFYTRRISGVYDFLDGKQRMKAISSYLDDGFALANIPPVTYESYETGEDVTVNISGLHFSELPEELQDAINSFSLTIYYYENISDAQVAEMFRKLNNGKPLSTKDRNIASCADIKSVAEIGSHKLFDSILTSKGRENRKQIPLVMKIWCMLFTEDVSFESKNFNKVMEETIISDDERKILDQVLDTLNEVYAIIGEIKPAKEATMIRRKLKSETHLISFVPFVKKAIEDGINNNMLTEFFCYFYGNEDGASISETYNDTVKGGSAKAINISRRDDELKAAWDEFFKTDDIDEKADTEMGEELEMAGQPDTDDEESDREVMSFTDDLLADMETPI